MTRGIIGRSLPALFHHGRGIVAPSNKKVGDLSR